MWINERNRRTSTEFPSPEVFHILISSLTALRFVLQKFTSLTELSIMECQNIAQKDFDELFRLPAITYQIQMGRTRR